MVQTKLARDAKAAYSTLYNTTEGQAPNVPAMLAFGVRLTNIMVEGRSKEFRNQVETCRADAVNAFTVDLNSVDLRKGSKTLVDFRDQMQGRANIFEEQRQQKQANFCRTLVALCEALVGPTPTTYNYRMAISRAAMKSVYAGADHEKVQQAALLLFG